MPRASGAIRRDADVLIGHAEQLLSGLRAASTGRPSNGTNTEEFDEITQVGTVLMATDERRQRMSFVAEQSGQDDVVPQTKAVPRWADGRRVCHRPFFGHVDFCSHSQKKDSKQGHSSPGDDLVEKSIADLHGRRPCR